MTNRKMSGVTLLWDMPEEEVGLYRWQKVKLNHYCEEYGRVCGPDFVIRFMHDYGIKQPIFDIQIIDPFCELLPPFNTVDGWYMGYKNEFNVPLQKFKTNKDFRKWFSKVALPIIYEEMDRRAKITEIDWD